MTNKADRAAQRARAAKRRRTWTITRFSSLAEAKDAECRAWAKLPAHLKMLTISELTTAAYAMASIPIVPIKRTPGILMFEPRHAADD
jgi:hypothetical protein